MREDRDGFKYVVGHTLLQTPKYVLSAGIVGSSSTYIYNLMREILEFDSPGLVLALYSDAWIPDFVGNWHLLLKCHSGSPSLQTAIATVPLQPIITVRHPGDSVCSDMDRFNLPFEQAVARVAGSLEFAVSLSNRPNAHLFRYADDFMTAPATAATLADLLGVAVPIEKLASISAKYSAAQVRAYADNLDALPELERNPENDDIWCSTTQIHRNHIGKQSSNRWCDLPVAHRAVLASMLGPSARIFGYDFEA